jgi:hypothetical protein
MDLFVSHAWEDKAYIIELLQLPEFINIWIDKNEMAAGYALTHTIRQSIDDCHVFLIALSQQSITREWVAQELNWAVKVEEIRNRKVVLPLLLDTDVVTAEKDPLFASILKDRLYINATDRSATGMKRTTLEVSNTIFRWLNDWLEDVEPKGSGNTLFIERLDGRIKEFQKRLYALKAALNWPLSTLVKPDALAFLDSSKNDYNTFTKQFMIELTDWEDEVKWRFEKYPYKQYIKLVTFIRDEIYHGAAYALNTIITAVNSYDEIQSRGPDYAESVEKDNMNALSDFDAAVKELTSMTTEYLNLLKTE